jgi:hypothetical protein
LVTGSQIFESQSKFTLQCWSLTHWEQRLPPQSTSVSFPSMQPSIHEGMIPHGWHTPFQSQEFFVSQSVPPGAFSSMQPFRHTYIWHFGGIPHCPQPPPDDALLDDALLDDALLDDALPDDALLEDALLDDALLDDADAPPVPMPPPPEVEPPCHSSRPRIWAHAPTPSTAGRISHGAARALLPVRCDLPAVLMALPSARSDHLEG